MNHCGTQVIETKRLVLRPFVLADAADLLELWIADPAVQGEYGEPTYETMDAVETLLRKWIAGYESPAFYRWAMIEQESSRCIGQIAFCRVYEDCRAAEIEYCVGHSRWGRGYAGEALAAVAQLGQHTIHGIGQFAHFLDEQDLALGIDLIGSAQRGGQQRQVTAAQTALGCARHHSGDGAAFGVDKLHRLTEQDGLDERSGVLIQAVAPGTHHLHMVRLHIADLVQGVEHSGDVAVAAEQLGILFDGIPVQQGQDAVEAVTATGADDTLDAVIGKGGVDVGGAHGVGARQKAVLGGGAGIEHRLQAHVTDSLGQFLGGLGSGAGTAQNGHTVAGLKMLRTDHSHFLQSDI